MKNKILLVCPGGFGSIFPEIPLSLLYVSWALKKKNFDIEILDARIDDYNEIKDNDYLFVGITSMTGQMIKEGLKIAKYIKRLNEDIPIVWGGVHVSLLTEQSLKNPYVDIVVRGEGELTIQELAYNLQNKLELSRVNGIAYKIGNKIIHNPDRKFMDLDDIDIELPYDLFKMDKYVMLEIPVHTSRGCPYRCGFCYNTVFNKRRWRFKSAERVLDEIEYLVKKFNCNKISFVWEDEFFISISRIKKICKGLIRRGLNVEWNSFCRFNSLQKVDNEFLEIIEKSGCNLLAFGGESGSQRLLDDIIKKDITVDQMIKTTEYLSHTDITQVVSFMSGVPTETYDDLNETFNLIDKLSKINPNIYFNGVFLYTPYPGTQLFEYVVEEYGYEFPDSLEEWSEYGIYRDVGIKWHNPGYVKKCKTISILTRFPFWKDKFLLKDISSVIGSSRFNKFPLNIAYYLLAKIAIFRWKNKIFIAPVELNITEKILLKLRGFV